MVALPLSAPKLSGFTSVLAQPEKQFSTMVKSALGVSLPKGPNEMLQSFQQNLEVPGTSTSGFPTLPKLDLPALPPLPNISGILPGMGKSDENTQQKNMYNHKPQVDQTTGQPPKGAPGATPTRITASIPTLVKNGTPSYARTPGTIIPTLTK